MINIVRPKKITDTEEIFERELTEFEQQCAEQPCLIEAFFKRQRSLPASMRSNSCLISCPCPRCSPRM